MVKQVYPYPFADEWRYQDPRTLNFRERLMQQRGIIPNSSRHVNYPKFKGTVPAYYEYLQYIPLVPHAFFIPVVRTTFTALTGRTIHPIAMFFIMWMVLYNMFSQFGDHLNKLALKFGYLDGETERDSIGREHVPKMFSEMVQGISLRAGIAVLFAYDRNEPFNLSWWLPLQVAAMSIIADFVYYWVHRMTHESDSMWYLHRLHHTTKHPNFLLLGYADEPQEFFDAVASPLIMHMLYPVSFDTFAVWTVLYLSIETMGHAGLRMYYPTILASPFLRPFGLELTLEDHDLHHRMGWRKSFNYSKQTLLWDELFGTRGERLETKNDNVDWDSTPGQWLERQQSIPQ